ncbi:MAG: Zn-dependent alcohol dehydrogenase [Actinobacteria bacterium]|nr:Zn-dependent alcohol dehydrogenase [Actinomycetota bacterium]
MKAIVYRGGDARAAFVDVDLAPPGPGEVEVAIAAAGVCHSDLHVVRGDWEVPTPVVLGHEGAGEVVAVGAGVEALVPGDHVVLSWVPSCGECRPCRAGRPAQCVVAATVTAPGGVLFDGTSRLSAGGERLYHYLAVSSFAERVVVPASGAIKVRDDAPLEPIALIGCAVATGVGAVRNTAAVEAGATVAVIGCGGVGLSCVQGARLAGATQIVAIDLVPAKLESARRLGATDALAGGAGAVERLRELLPEGVDYCFDAIGHTTTTEEAIEMLALGGAAVIVGLPPTGSRASFEPLVLAEADQRILGSNYGSVDARRDIPALVDLYMDGELELDALISGRRPLAEAPEALEDLAAGKALRQLLIP